MLAFSSMSEALTQNSVIAADREQLYRDVAICDEIFLKNRVRIIHSIENKSSFCITMRNGISHVRKIRSTRFAQRTWVQ